MSARSVLRVKNSKGQARSVLNAAALLVVGISVVFPFYIMIIESFHPNLVSLPYPVELLPKAFSLDNYRLLFLNNPVFTWIMNSLIISLGTCLFQALFCSMAAFGFQRTEFRFKNLIKNSLMLLLVIPIQTRILPLFTAFSALKLINSYYAWIPFLSDAFGIYLLIQYMTAIPKDYDEAAKIDGASLAGIYSKIIIPQTSPALVVLITYNFINQWNDFLYPLIMVRSDRMYTLQLGLSNIFSSATRGEGGGIGVALAGAVISFLPTLLIYVFFQDRIINGMNISAGVKG